MNPQSHGPGSVTVAPRSSSALGKLLFDLFPVILFFSCFKLAGADVEAAHAFALAWLGPLVADGLVPVEQAPILLATAAAIVASLLQVSYLLARRRRVDLMLWLSFGVIVVFGGATIWLRDETFIKWKPSILYWIFAAVLLGGRLIAQRNLLRSVLGKQLDIPELIWERLLWAWTSFFTGIGAVNLIVAYSVSTQTWVSFKLFGLFGMSLAFMLAMGFWLARHVKEKADA